MITSVDEILLKTCSSSGLFLVPSGRFQTLGGLAAMTITCSPVKGKACFFCKCLVAAFVDSQLIQQR